MLTQVVFNRGLLNGLLLSGWNNGQILLVTFGHMFSVLVIYITGTFLCHNIHVLQVVQYKCVYVVETVLSQWPKPY